MTTETYSEVMKDVVDTLVTVFDKELISLNLLVDILGQVHKKYPEESFLLSTLSKYKTLLGKFDECLAAIESGRENAPLEKELKQLLDPNHIELESINQAKRWVALKNKRLVKHEEEN
jgi:hypothetical protein